MIQPVTKSNELIEEINEFLESARAYRTEDEFWFRQKKREAEKLLKVSPIEGHNVLGNLYGTAGDLGGVVRHFDMATKIENLPILWGNRAGIISNLGYFSDAQDAYAIAAAPEQGYFSNHLSLGLLVGAFHKIVELSAIALRMNSTFDREKFDIARRAAMLMDEFSVTDRDLGTILDVAGEILREERMFFMGNMPNILVWDQDATEKYLAISFRLPVSGHRASVLDAELGRRLYMHPEMPFQVMLNYESGLPLNERFPERTAITG